MKNNDLEFQVQIPANMYKKLELWGLVNKNLTLKAIIDEKIVTQVFNYIARECEIESRRIEIELPCHQFQISMNGMDYSFSPEFEQELHVAIFEKILPYKVEFNFHIGIKDIPLFSDKLEEILSWCLEGHSFIVDLYVDQAKLMNRRDLSLH